MEYGESINIKNAMLLVMCLLFIVSELAMFSNVNTTSYLARR